MSKKTKWTLIIGTAAAVISAAVLLILFWDRLLEKFSCCRLCRKDDYDFIPFEEEDNVITYDEEELDEYED